MDGWGLCKDLGALAEQLKGPRELMGRVVAPLYRGGLLMVLLQLLEPGTRPRAPACQLPGLTGVV